MKKGLFLVFLATFSSAVLAEGMKAGLWEVRPIKQIVDGKDLMAQISAAQAQMNQAMANMPAAQRKQMEAMMGQHGVAMPENGAQRICIGPEQANRKAPLVDPDGRCEPVKLQQSGSRTTFEVNCKQDGRSMVGKGESTVTANSILTKTQMTMSDAQGKHTMQNETQMRYLGSDCRGVRPIGQVRN